MCRHTFLTSLGCRAYIMNDPGVLSEWFMHRLIRPLLCTNEFQYHMDHYHLGVYPAAIWRYGTCALILDVRLDSLGSPAVRRVLSTRELI
jgi:hypothetical protein